MVDKLQFIGGGGCARALPLTRQRTFLQKGSLESPKTFLTNMSKKEGIIK
jgi:hypothetical protein